MADLGSQIQSGFNVLKAFLSDYETKKFFAANGVREITFQHYPKGNSSLGSLIEVLVKQVKFLLAKSIKTNVLEYFQFDLLIKKAIHLINKRPIGFKDGLRSLHPDQLPESITPELIIKGYETIPVGIIPDLEPISDDYSVGDLDSELEKLRTVREKLIDVYHTEFLSVLIDQATDKVHRYKRVKHTTLQPGDIVLLVEKNLKRYCYRDE